MEAEKQTRNRRSKEEIIAEYEAKIEKLEEQIEAIEAKIEAVKNPKPRLSAAAKMQRIVDRAKAAKMSPEEIAEKLGISMDELD